MQLRVGEIVRYVLTDSDADIANARRSAKEVQGNLAREGEIIPALVVWPHDGEQGPTFNGQGFLDGDDSIWLTSIPRDDEQAPGTWHYPEGELPF